MNLPKFKKLETEDVGSILNVYFYVKTTKRNYGISIILSSLFSLLAFIVLCLAHLKRPFLHPWKEVIVFSIFMFFVARPPVEYLLTKKIIGVRLIPPKVYTGNPAFVQFLFYTTGLIILMVLFVSWLL